MRKKTKAEVLAPGDEVEQIIREAIVSVEKELKIEDAGWINLSATSQDIITSNERQSNLKLSRLYYTKDPLGRQAIRLWTDYTFGSGMTWQAEDERVTEVLNSFWENRENRSVLSAKGQRKSSDKLLVDGEVFYAIFLGAKGEALIRFIDPLEITEIITDPNDIEKVMFYRRQWSTPQGAPKEGIYRSTTNQKNEPGIDSNGKVVQKTEDALVYHITYNTITQRGNPLLLPALDWIKQYRRFLASRIAIMLALSRWAWKQKVKGGSAAVDAIKAVTEGETPNAGSILLENMGVDTTPIKTETGASAAYQDARLIKLQICAAVGIPEQYFGDISIGNLATAKTVELPMMKMFQSYQKIWNDVYTDINEIILEHNNVPEDKWYVDMDFPPIAPEDVTGAATALAQILTAMPDLAYADEVKQMALMTLGINDPAEVLDNLSKEAKSDPNVALAKALKVFRESLKT